MHKICKMHNQKCLDNNNSVNPTLLNTRSIPIGLPSPATLLADRLVRSMLPELNKEPININYDGVQHEAIKLNKINTLRAMMLAMSHFLFP